MNINTAAVNFPSNMKWEAIKTPAIVRHRTICVLFFNWKDNRSKHIAIVTNTWEMIKLSTKNTWFFFIFIKYVGGIIDFAKFYQNNLFTYSSRMKILTWYSSSIGEKIERKTILTWCRLCLLKIPQTLDSRGVDYY